MDTQTMTELMLAANEDERYNMIRKHLDVVLDFVERHNKFDKEYEAAISAQWLSELTLKPKE